MKQTRLDASMFIIKLTLFLGDTLIDYSLLYSLVFD